jgi:hypothetical protein
MTSEQAISAPTQATMAVHGNGLWLNRYIICLPIQQRAPEIRLAL